MSKKRSRKNEAVGPSSERRPARGRTAAPASLPHQYVLLGLVPSSVRRIMSIPPTSADAGPPISMHRVRAKSCRDASAQSSSVLLACCLTLLMITCRRWRDPIQSKRKKAIPAPATMSTAPIAVYRGPDVS